MNAYAAPLMKLTEQLIEPALAAWLALERSNMKLTDETWNQIIDEESQARGIESPYIRHVSRRSIERVLEFISEPPALTDEQWARLRTEFGTGGSTIHRWLCRADIDRVLSRRPASAPDPVDCEQISSREWVPKSPVHEPAPQQDDAAVIEEAARLGNETYYPKPTMWREYPNSSKQDWRRVARAIFSIARRGMVPASELESAKIDWGVLAAENVSLQNKLARLTHAPKPTKQERVTVTRMGASEHVFVEFDGKIIYQFDDHEDEENDAEFHAKRYAAGLRQELEETK